MSEKGALYGWFTWFRVFAALLVLASAASLHLADEVVQRRRTETGKDSCGGISHERRGENEYYKTPEHDVTTLWQEAVGLEGTGPLSGTEFFAAVQSIPVVGKDGSPAPLPGAPWPELEEVEGVARPIQEFDGYKMHEAARLGGAARFPRNTSQGIGMVLPEVGPLRNGARMLALEAHVKAHDQDPHGAAESIHAIFMLAKSLENDPVMISLLVHVAIHSTGVGVLKDLLPHLEFREEDLRRLQADLRRADKSKVLVTALAGERGFGMEAMRNPAATMPDVDAAPWGASNEDVLLYLEHFDLMVAAAGKSG